MAGWKGDMEGLLIGSVCCIGGWPSIHDDCCEQVAVVAASHGQSRASVSVLVKTRNAEQTALSLINPTCAPHVA